MQHKLQSESIGGNIASRYGRHANLPAPSAWVARYAAAIPRRGRVLDLACGSGRHLALLADLGYSVAGVDRDISRAAHLSELANVELLEYDLESDRWPFATASFAGIVVSNYLHRPLLPCLADSLCNGGILIYTTFASGNERFGRPRNPAFLLRPGELPAVFGMLETLAFEDVTTRKPNPAVRQHYVGRKKPAR